MGKIRIRTGRGTGTIEVDEDASNGLEMNFERSKKQGKKQQQEEWFTQVVELVQEN